MLIGISLHVGEPLAPHDLALAWALDPLVLSFLAVLVVLYARGRGTRRHGWFLVAIGSLAMALISPLDAMSGSLASAHMVQHLLLVLVTGPALVWSGAGPAAYSALPVDLRRSFGRLRRGLGLTPGWIRRTVNPGFVLALHAAALIGWHLQGPYQEALESRVAHFAQHAAFLGSAVLFWSVLLSPHRRDGAGGGVLAVFGLGLQSIFLALLMTFAQAPWYPHYAETTTTWGLSPLADQQLAGAIMWVPAGLFYSAAGLLLLVRWLRSTEAAETRALTRSKTSA